MQKRSQRPVPAYVSPHANRELALMLAGRKPLARFTRELAAPHHRVGDEDFDAHVESGKIVRIIVRGEEVERRYYCLPNEEWRVKVMEILFYSSVIGLDEDDLHRLDGTLLGYRKSHVEHFIERVHRLRAMKR